MLYVYCTRPDVHVRTLALKLGATLVRRFDGMHLWLKRDRLLLGEGDSVICWGNTLPEFDGVKMLNSRMAPLSKLERLIQMKVAGLGTLSITQSQDGKKGKLTGYLPRAAESIEGRDLLYEDVKRPAFWTRQEAFVEETQIHVFKGVAVLNGVKVPKPEWPIVEELQWEPDKQMVHPWVKTSAGGWDISIVKGVEASYPYVALRALVQLGLDFACVTIGKTAFSGFQIIDIDLQPSLAHPEVGAEYLKLLKGWVG